MKPQLILFDGITGSGKSTLLEFLRNNYRDCVKVGKKVTTRRVRVTDNKWEFDFLSEIPSTYKKYQFESVGNFYSINDRELHDAINGELVYTITCSNAEIIRKLKRHFRTIVIYIYRPWNNADFDILLKSRNTTNQTDIENRKAEVKNALIEYSDHLDLYNHVILNIGMTDGLTSQLSKILWSYGIMIDKK